MAYIEKNCTVEHAGKTFEAGGAIVTADFLIAYLGKDGALTDWHGKQIGSFRVLSSWRTPRSYVSDRMYSVECFNTDGERYVGRSAGEGMIVRAKRSPKR
jgi:hypothetical protein